MGATVENSTEACSDTFDWEHGTVLVFPPSQLQTLASCCMETHTSQCLWKSSLTSTDGVPWIARSFLSTKQMGDQIKSKCDGQVEKGNRRPILLPKHEAMVEMTLASSSKRHPNCGPNLYPGLPHRQRGV